MNSSKTDNLVTLYIAEHNVTGLKYFGKSTSFFTVESLERHYLGGGVYWNQHLKIHGRNVKMSILGIYDVSEVEQIALDFSEKNNIVNSKDWANLMLENGLDGSAKGQRPKTSKTINSAEWLETVGRKKIEKCSGENNHQTNTIEIYDEQGILRFTSYGSFTKFCKEHNLPRTPFFNSIKTGKPLFETNSGLAKAKKFNTDIFKGWYAVKLTRNINTSITFEEEI